MNETMKRTLPPTARRRLSTLAILSLAMAWVAGCGGLKVWDPNPGALAAVQGQPITAIYFNSLDTAETQMHGDHGPAEEWPARKGEWHIHFIAGAHMGVEKWFEGAKIFFLKEKPADYDLYIMQKMEVPVEFATEAPADAIVVSAKVLESREAAGAARAFIGGMAGKTWLKVQVDLSRGGERVYSFIEEGEYHGGAWSWGYESLGAQEDAGRKVMNVLRALQAGEEIGAR